jgi:hypothetical protein
MRAEKADKIVQGVESYLDGNPHLEHTSDVAAFDTYVVEEVFPNRETLTDEHIKTLEKLAAKVHTQVDN